ncbi:gamma-glutamylcyclotransferase family protein [Thermohalobacter berrensis]|uniref:Gamma-glutamylcyclotransferase AIG2-like domain-containing protein n=1 Tax=Thermohalobacter berrensis TaxID=99594 RepID=A0A419T475_9FIRM|nr:gamma-glutamylcyclotransferase family protein [Thermohalobacter berrensis]RKD32249.1 hypothetical protein BET03_02755 [Thermohalobacter berrensis]
MCKKIFVYGTLMEDFYNYNYYLKGKVIKREYARTKGELYHLTKEGYPAMVKGDDYVYGELIVVKDFGKTLKILDQLEGFYKEKNEKNEYNRVVKEIEVLKNNTKHKAYVYEYNAKSKDELKEKEVYIPNGDWRRFMEKEKAKVI